MKNFYQACLCLVIGCEFAVLPAFSADQSWQSKPGYFSSRGSYSGSPPDLLGRSAVEYQTVQPATADTGLWQTREITNSAVIEPSSQVIDNARLPSQRFIWRPQQRIQMPLIDFGKVMRFGLL